MPAVDKHILTNQDLDEGFHGDQFACVFQPKINLATGHVTGIEALARWQSPELGELGPDDFLPALQQQGRLQELTQFVFVRALSAAQEWHANGYALPVHINVAAQDLIYPGLVQFSEIRLRRHDLAAHAVRLDLQTDDARQLPPEGQRRLSRLLGCGFGLALQQTATDECALPDLRADEIQVPWTTPDGIEDIEALRNIVRIAQARGATTTAIGVEHMKDLEIAKAVGFEDGTGHAIAEPMRIEAILDWTRSRQPPTRPARPMRRAG